MTTRSGALAACALGVCLFFAALPVAAECKITVTSDPSLPAANLLQNPGFEDGIKPWDAFAVTFNDGVTGTEAHSGRHCYKFVGQKAVKKGIRQVRVGPQEFKPPVPAGTPIRISAWCKTVGTDPQGGGFDLTAAVTYSDGTGSYISAPSFPKADHDWAKVTTVYGLEKDMKRIDLFYVALNYDQAGEAYFDDLVVAVGKLKLSYRAECPGTRAVRVYSEEQGLVQDSGALAKDTRVYDGTLESAVLPDRFLVQVEDVAGNVYKERYPKNDEPAFPKLASGETSVFDRFPRETLKAGASETYPVMLPATPGGKTVILQLKARAQWDTVAGCTYILGIKVNGKDVTTENLMERKARFTLADGREMSTSQGPNGFALYYSPDFFPIDPQIQYYPTDMPNNDPYTFKFDVTKLVSEGKNTITILHAGGAGEATQMIVEDAKLVIR